MAIFSPAGSNAPTISLWALNKAVIVDILCIKETC